MIPGFGLLDMIWHTKVKSGKEVSKLIGHSSIIHFQ